MLQARRDHATSVKFGPFEEQSVDELTNELRAIGEEIDSWKSTYNVESPRKLRQSIGREDLSADDRRERLEVIEEWEYNIQVREALQLAISLQSSLTRLDADPRLANRGSDASPKRAKRRRWYSSCWRPRIYSA